MKKILFILAAILLVFGLENIAFSNETTGNISATTTPSKAENTTDEAFDKMMQVLTHKRCVNCHPAGNQPRQGEDSHLHNFGIQRGPDNHGLAALQCQSCHQSENNDFSGVPGAPDWSLAPIEMRWEGLTRVEIAQSMLNRENNGNRSLDDIVKHLTEHELVLWAWKPGVNADGIPREKPPVSKEDFIKAVKEWAAAGAVIPKQ